MHYIIYIYNSLVHSWHYIYVHIHNKVQLYETAPRPAYRIYICTMNMCACSVGNELLLVVFGTLYVM